ncbi:MAG TPA: aminotransferase class IV, partial [Trueperaceae bacterium]
FMRVAVATETVDESNPARRHKTTDRYLYELGRPFAPAHELEDVLFFNTRGELVEAAISTVYVGTESDLATSPLSSGALPGVLREELIELGLVREAVLGEEDLRSAPVVMVSSSVRGLRRVRVEPGRVSLTA